MTSARRAPRRSPSRGPRRSTRRATTDENNDLAARAIDGDPSTSWHSDRYSSPEFGGLKKGLGLAVDLGETSTVTSVTVTAPAPTGPSSCAPPTGRTSGAPRSSRPAGSPAPAGSNSARHARLHPRTDRLVHPAPRQRRTVVAPSSARSTCGEPDGARGETVTSATTARRRPGADGGPRRRRPRRVHRARPPAPRPAVGRRAADHARPGGRLGRARRTPCCRRSATPPPTGARPRSPPGCTASWSTRASTACGAVPPARRWRWATPTCRPRTTSTRPPRAGSTSRPRSRACPRPSARRSCSSTSRSCRWPRPPSCSALPRAP